MLILRYFKNLFRYKFYFNFPSNKEIIIYDNSTMSEIKQIVKDYKYIELDLRNNFNLFILLKILLKFKKSTLKLISKNLFKHILQKLLYLQMSTMYCL